MRQASPNSVHACKHTHIQINTNLGAVPQSVVGILYRQTGQEAYVMAKRIEKNWEGLFLVGWELVRKKHNPKCIHIIHLKSVKSIIL